MAAIGIELDPDQLVLTRGRDFKWHFENLDENEQPIPFPAGDLFFELQTRGEHNSKQEVRVLRANEGTYKLGLANSWSAPIDYYDAVENPHSQAGDITDALEGIPAIGPGNVKVTPAQIYPVWRINVVLNGTSQNEIQELNITNLLGWLGANIGKGRMRLSYKHNETGLLEFTSSAADIQTALERLPRIGTGNVQVTKVSDGKFRIEFVGALAGRDVDQILVTAYETDSDNFFDKILDTLTTVTSRTIQAGRKAALDERLMNLLNKYVNEFFDLFDEALGLDIDFEIRDNLNFTIVTQSTIAFAETDLVTFAIDVAGSSLKTFFNGILDLTGMFTTVAVDFYWNHVFQVEFVGALANKHLPLLQGDASALGNDANTPGIQPAVEVYSVNPGKEPITLWHFDIEGTLASLKVESEEADKVQARTIWQLVFLPAGEPAGGEPVARGRVWVQE